MSTDPTTNIAIVFIICMIPMMLLVIAFIEALGKRPGNRRRNPDMFYDGPERRCRFRSSCPVGGECRDPQHCIFFEARQSYLDKLNERNNLFEGPNGQRHSIE